MTLPSLATRTSRKRRQVFTASGSFVAPSGVDVVEVTLVGGGGGGTDGSGTTFSGGAGGGGAVVYRAAYPVTPGSSYAVTVGAGGARSNPLTPFRGNKGGDSAFDNLTAWGGCGGNAAASSHALPCGGGGGIRGGGSGFTGGAGGGGGIDGNLPGSGLPEANNSLTQHRGTLGAFGSATVSNNTSVAGGRGTRGMGGGGGGAAAAASATDVPGDAWDGGGVGGASGVAGGDGKANTGGGAAAAGEEQHRLSPVAVGTVLSSSSGTNPSLTSFTSRLVLVVGIRCFWRPARSPSRRWSTG